MSTSSAPSGCPAQGSTDPDAASRGRPSLGDLALVVHEALDNDASALSIRVPADVVIDLSVAPGTVLENGELRFPSRAAVNAAVARHTQLLLGPAGVRSHEQLFSQAYDLWVHEIGETETASGRLLHLANAEVDVLGLAAQRIAAGHDVFDVLHVAVNLLPYAQALAVQSILALSDAQASKTAGDLGGGALYSALRSWFAQHPATAQQVADAVIVAPTAERAHLLGVAFLGWFDADPESAAAAVLSYSPDLRAPLPTTTAWVSARMLEKQRLGHAASEPLRDLIRQRMAAPDDERRGAGLDAATHLLSTDRAFDADLDALALARDQLALAHLAWALSSQLDQLLAQNRFFHWLNRCAALQPKFGNAVRQLDFMLSRLLEPRRGHGPAVLHFLTAWVTDQNHRELMWLTNFPEVFPSTTQKLLGQPALFGQLVTCWFMEDDLRACAAAMGLMQQPRSLPSPLRLEVAVLNQCTGADLEFLAKRLTGWIIRPEPLLALLLSTLQTSHAQRDVYPWLTRFLVDEIGYDYPGTTIEVLRQAAADPVNAAHSSLLTDALDAIDRRMKSLEALPDIQERSPPAQLSRRFARLRHQQMAQSQKKAEEKSVLRQIMTSVTLKAGRESFQFNGHSGTFGAPTRLQEISVHMEIPRRERLDPVGNMLRLRQLRGATRPSP